MSSHRLVSLLGPLRVSRATLEHFQEVQRISRGVYGGRDYALKLYKAWFQEESADKSSRNSLVLLDVGGKVVGFQTYLLMPGAGGRTLAVQQALRIDPSLSGRGVGRRFMLLCHQHLRDNFRKVSELKAVDLRPLGPSGRLVCSRLERSFFVHYHGKMIDQEEEEASSIREYPVDEFLRKVDEDRRGFVSLCLERGFFVVGLIPFYLRSALDLLRARPYGCQPRYALGGGGGGGDADDIYGNGLSVLTGPYAVECGSCFAMDVYAMSEEDMKAHIKFQLRRMRSLSTRSPSSRVALTLACRGDLVSSSILDKILNSPDFDGLLAPFEIYSKAERAKRGEEGAYFVYEKDLETTAEIRD